PVAARNSVEQPCWGNKPRLLQRIEEAGAGEGNRTLVISLEGFYPVSNFNSYSDKSAPYRQVEAKQLIRLVRTSAYCALRRRPWRRRLDPWMAIWMVSYLPLRT
ncbi:MAG: hypothetical protein WAR76_20170, partial [Xanthobacteraceae bacterium]